MAIQQFDLTDKFRYILKNILNLATSETITVKVNNGCLTFNYIIKTNDKDNHRKLLKRYCSDSCISIVVGEDTEIKVSFGIVNYKRIDSFIIEFDNNSKPKEITEKILLLLKKYIS